MIVFLSSIVLPVGYAFGQTGFCDGKEPQEIVSKLQELVEAFEELAVKYDLYKVKTIGDAFMAASGLLTPVANPVLETPFIAAPFWINFGLMIRAARCVQHESRIAAAAVA